MGILGSRITKNLSLLSLLMNKQVIQSISGGMDSTCLLLHHLARRRTVHLISFDYGQKHKLELERLDANLKYLHDVIAQEPDLIECRFTHRRLVVPFGEFASSTLTNGGDVPRGHYAEGNMKATVVPNRNAIFASFLFSLALSVKNENPWDEVSISLGVHSGDHAVYPDCRGEFWESIMDSFRLGNWDAEDIGMSMPYIDMDKEAILREAIDDCTALGIDFDTVLGNTNTSYAPTEDGKADGYTGSDVERIEAFYRIGRKDPVEYKDGWDKTLAAALQTLGIS